uniref:MD-2-related lipid-recognition domain-containing protein n=1 Tax=Stomoxys calcitrans TaxID=35570 RepID=A0A1I8P3I9_STOCA
MGAVKILVALFCYLQAIDAAKIIHISGVECPHEYNNVVALYNCSLRNNRQGDSLVNLALQLNEDSSNITGHITITIKRNNKPTETFVAFDMDLCQALSSDPDHVVVEIITAKAQQDAVLPLDCPLQKGILYKAIKYPINAIALPENIPEANWAILSDYYVNGQKAFTFNIYGRIEDTKHIEMHKGNEIGDY